MVSCVGAVSCSTLDVVKQAEGSRWGTHPAQGSDTADMCLVDDGSALGVTLLSAPDF